MFLYKKEVLKGVFLQIILKWNEQEDYEEDKVEEQEPKHREYIESYINQMRVLLNGVAWHMAS